MPCYVLLSNDKFVFHALVVFVEVNAPIVRLLLDMKRKMFEDVGVTQHMPVSRAEFALPYGARQIPHFAVLTFVNVERLLVGVFECCFHDSKLSVHFQNTNCEAAQRF